jgi:glucan 1,4-alpha-glucosidase
MSRHSRTIPLAIATGLATALTLLVPTAHAQADGNAPGPPGATTTWRTGYKDGVGTALSRESKVWYTLAEGTLSEVYYPAADTANVKDLQFMVTDGSTFSQREFDGTTRQVQLADTRSLTYRQITTDNAGRWRLTKTYVTDPAVSTVMIDVTFQSLDGGAYQLFTLYDPSLANNAGHDTASTTGDALVASDTHVDGKHVSSALLSTTGFSATSNGYLGTSDGWTDLENDHQLDWSYPSAGPGNVVQTGEIPVDGPTTHFTLALGFGDDQAAATAAARGSLARGYDAVKARYQTGWHEYLGSLKQAPEQPTGDLRTQYNVALMTVRSHEDKTFPGAYIASLTLPWGQRVNADQGGGGYHFVWARDLYEQVTSLLTAGDTPAANRAVTWLFRYQQEADGHFPQTSHVDGTPDQRNIQLDETAYPILLAWHVQRFGGDFYRTEIRPAADYLVKAGPKTPQERWEETGGYSPSTLASQIAALTAAADIAHRNADEASAALYRATADLWQRSLEKWLFTTTGPVGDGRYYMRINADENPDDADSRDFGNGAGVHDERSVLDAGFLEFVRLGVKAPGDRFIAESLAEADASISQMTPHGRMWHRYTYDGYGEKADGSPWDGTGIGRLWPLLGGERGEFEVARGNSGLSFLKTMAGSANAGYMIPEQVWDQEEPTSYGHVFGEGTGSAGPLSWAMAQYVRLSRAIGAGAPVETPKVVSKRYVGTALSVPRLTVSSPDPLTVADSKQVQVAGTTAGSRLYVDVNGDRQQVRLTGDGRFSVTVPLTQIRNQVTVVAVDRRGGTNIVTSTVVAYGDRVGGFTDPTGDDDGPGTYVYPTNPVYVPGAFDITGVDVYADTASGQDNVVFVTGIHGEITNPWGGDQISHQRINIYLGNGSGGPTAALPGTNLDTASAWSAVVVADGRYDSKGVFAPDGSKIADVRLVAIPETRQIAAIVPRSALGGLDPATASYGVGMFGNAEPGEGVGYIRPVYDRAYWDAGDPWWIKEYRFGGGAGVWEDSADHDTDTRDPNALDIIVGAGQDQHTVMDWQTASPVRLPMVPISQ